LALKRQDEIEKLKDEIELLDGILLEKDSAIKNFELRVQNLNQANDQLREETNRLNLLIVKGDERIKS